MADESATDLVIRLRTDGADQAAGEIKKSGEAVDEVEKKIEKATESSHSLMGEQLGSIRTAHHLFEGLKEIGEGGPVAIAGVATEVRVLSEVFEEAIGELAPELIIITTLISVGFTSAFREAGKEAREAGKDMSGAFDATKESLDVTLNAIKENNAFPTLSQQAKQFTSELNIQEQNVRTLQAALDRLQDAKFGAQEALLNRQEQVELQGKTGEDAEAIKLKYEKQLSDLRGEHEVDKANREIAAKQAALIDLQNQVKAIEAEKAAASADVAASYARTNAGATGASLGLSDYQYNVALIKRLDEQEEAHKARQVDTRTPEASFRGDIMPALTPEERAQRQAAQDSLPALQHQEQFSGPQYTEGIKRLNEERTKLQQEELARLKTAEEGGYEPIPGFTREQNTDHYSEQITKQFSEKFAEIDKMVAAFTATQEGQAETKKRIDEAVKGYIEAKDKLEKLQGTDGSGGAIAAAQKDVETAKAALETAKTNADAQAQKVTNEAQATAQKQSDDLAKTKRETEEDNLQNLANKAGIDPTLKKTYERQLAADKAQDVLTQAAIKERGQQTVPEAKAATQAEAATKAAGISPPVVVTPAGPPAGPQQELDRSVSRNQQAEAIETANTVNSLEPLESAAGTTKEAAGKLTALLAGLQNHTIQVSDFVRQVVDLTTRGLAVQASELAAMKEQLAKLQNSHNATVAGQ